MQGGGSKVHLLRRRRLGEGGVVGRLAKNKSPVLARCFSDVFSVYSAKRFPGVVESTPLSRCFATQGIRIPIRKDAAKGEKEKDEDED